MARSRLSTVLSAPHLRPIFHCLSASFHTLSNVCPSASPQNPAAPYFFCAVLHLHLLPVVSTVMCRSLKSFSDCCPFANFVGWDFPIHRKILYLQTNPHSGFIFGYYLNQIRIMNYLKSLVVCLAGIAVIFAFWAFSMGIGPMHALRPFHSDTGQFFFSLGLMAIAGLAFMVIEQKYANWTILGWGLVVATAAGVVTSLAILIGDWISNSRGGFWAGAGYAFLGIIVVGTCSACFGTALKNLVLGLFRLDFVIVLLSFIVGVSAFFCGMGILSACFMFHPACGIMVFVGLTGNVTAIAGPTISGGEIVDGYGNVHYEISKNADGSVTTTNGERMRQMPDGNYKEF